MEGGDDAKELESEKARSTVQLLFKAARLLNERAIERVRSRTGRPIRVAHTTLLPHVDPEGTRLTELASRLGVTKQAAGQLVDELVAMGLLERAPDPDDARAKLVRFSKRGRAAIFDGLAILKEIEEEIAELIGRPTLRSVHDALTAILEDEMAKGRRTAEQATKPAPRRRGR